MATLVREIPEATVTLVRTPSPAAAGAAAELATGWSAQWPGEPGLLAAFAFDAFRCLRDVVRAGARTRADALARLLGSRFVCGDDPRPPPAGADSGSDLGRGACGECPAGARCADGACLCEPPTTRCAGACVDLCSDPESCGACGRACPDGAPCVDGTCGCAAPLVRCAAADGTEACVDPTVEPAHCGSCGNRCPAGGACVAGACRCAGLGRVACPDAEGRAVCVDPATSVLHCGGCANRCGVGFDCTEGRCRCAGGRVACGEPDGTARCVEPQTDHAHCGACGNACGADEICDAGRCVDACPVGTACNAVEDCRGEPAVDPEVAGTSCIGESSLRIEADGVRWTETSWRGGYCVDHYGAGGSVGSCEPGRAASCAPCSRCMPMGTDPTHGPISSCLRACDPGMGDWRSDNGGCREGYQCSLEHQVCLPGCSSDEQCRSRVVDVDGDGVRDPGETHLDPRSSARCDAATHRCVGLPFDPASTFGAPCTTPEDCPEEGVCIPWPGGGYCARLACNLAGRECGPGGFCLSPWGDSAYGVCLDDCLAGDETDAGRILGASAGDPDCRVPGFRCYADAGGSAGGCVPGNYNDVREPNVGAPCETDAQCWSPFGNGSCFFANGQSFCTVTQCGLEPFAPTAGDSSVCPEGFVCEGDPTFFTFCVQACDPTAAETGCRDGFVCREMGEPRANVCFPACRSDADCLPSDRCTDGVCG